MSKPEDIPQDVWNVAEAKAIDYLNWFGAALKSDDQYVLAQTIARAILAAKAEEREACAQVADEYQYTYVARRIRKRGEA